MIHFPVACETSLTALELWKGLIPVGQCWRNSLFSVHTQVIIFITSSHIVFCFSVLKNINADFFFFFNNWTVRSYTNVTWLDTTGAWLPSRNGLWKSIRSQCTSIPQICYCACLHADQAVELRDTNKTLWEDGELCMVATCYSVGGASLFNIRGPTESGWASGCHQSDWRIVFNNTQPCVRSHLLAFNRWWW